VPDISEEEELILDDRRQPIRQIASGCAARGTPVYSRMDHVPAGHYCVVVETAAVESIGTDLVELHDTCGGLAGFRVIVCSATWPRNGVQFDSPR